VPWADSKTPVKWVRFPSLAEPGGDAAVMTVALFESVVGIENCQQGPVLPAAVHDRL